MFILYVQEHLMANSFFTFFAFAVTVLQGPGSDCKLQVFLYITIFTFFLWEKSGGWERVVGEYIVAKLQQQVFAFCV